MSVQTMHRQDNRGIEVSSPPSPRPLMEAIGTLAWYYSHDLDGHVKPADTQGL